MSMALWPLQALYQKQGRSRQFGSKQERDAHIGEEIKQLERAAAVKRSSAEDLRSQVQQLTSQLMDLSQVHRRLPLRLLLIHIGEGVKGFKKRGHSSQMSATCLLSADQRFTPWLKHAMQSREAGLHA